MLEPGATVDADGRAGGGGRLPTEIQSGNSVLAPSGQTLLFPAATLVKRQANRQDLTFDSLKEVDLLVSIVSVLGEDALT